MPVHNAGDFLMPSVESVLQQTFEDFELIVIDDCSSDGATDLLDGLGDDRIRVITNATNLGAAQSRNLGIEAARGSIVAIQDADDISVPTRFEQGVAMLGADPELCVVAGGHTYIDGDGNSMPHQSFDSSSVMGYGVIPTTNDGIALGLESYQPFGHGSVMARRSCMQAAGGYDRAFELAEDYALFSAMLISGCQFRGIPTPLYAYRIHGSGISRTRVSELHRSNRILGERVRAWSPPKRLTDWIALARSEPCLDRAEPRLLVIKEIVKHHMRQNRFTTPLVASCILIAAGPRCAMYAMVDAARAVGRRVRTTKGPDLWDTS
jgi:glycosyltransferase involved in cell wall biosynthesis